MLRIPLRDRMLFTGLEIEAGYVKLAQAQDFKRSRKIVKLIVKKSASQSQDDIAETLKSIIDELNGQVGYLTVCIPRHKLTARFLRFPTVNEKEIEAMIKLQSVKELPFSKEEIVSDYLVTEQTKDGYTKAALIIAHLDVINTYLDIFKKANIKLERITFSTEAIFSWYRAAFRQEGLRDSLIFIDIDNDNTDIAIFCNYHLAFARGLKLGVAQLREQADSKNWLAKEIRWTLEEYNKQEKTKKVEKILINQTGEIIEGLKPFLEQSFDLPCQTVAALRNLNCQETVFLGEYGSESSLLRVLGQVLDVSETRKLNLLPLAIQEKQKLKWKKKRVYKIIALLTGIIMLILFIFIKKIHDKKLYLFYLNKRIERTVASAMSIESMLKKVELIRARRKIEGSVIDALRQLHVLVPKDIYLSNFNFIEDDKEDVKISFRGVSVSMSKVFKFVDILENSAYFKNVQVKYVSGEKVKMSHTTDFKIQCTLEK